MSGRANDSDGVHLISYDNEFSLTSFLDYLCDRLRATRDNSFERSGGRSRPYLCQLDPHIFVLERSRQVRRLYKLHFLCLSRCRAPSGAHDQILVTV
jgi:hypothetical protein